MLFATLSAFSKWAGPEGWRKRRETIIPPNSRQKPTYDAYPDEREIPDEQIIIQRRDRRGRLRQQFVDLEGYSLDLINLNRDAKRGGIPTRDWLVGQILEARYRLVLRLAEELKAKERE